MLQSVPFLAMWCVAARTGGVAFGRPLIRSLLGSGFAAPALVRASLIVEPTSRCRLPNSNLRVALLGLVAGAVLSQPDAAECMPPSKRKAKAVAAPSAKKKAGPALTPSGWAHRPRRLALSVSSPRRAACTTTSRARWRTAPLSTPSSPPPTASSGWSLEARGLGGGNRDHGLRTAEHENRDRRYRT